MKSGMFVTQARIKEMKIVNGRVVVDRNIRQNISPEGEHIFGHNGSKQLDIWRLPKRQTRKSKRTKKNKKTNKTKKNK